ncbi:hypothetical protein MTO96_049722 [Rhipicephalus appendiculatus]
MQHYHGTLLHQSEESGEQTPFIETAMGIMNLLELCMVLVLFGGLLKQDLVSRFHHFFCCSAAAYFFNDFCFFFTSLLSKESAACMPSIFYYTMFQFTSFATFVPCGIYTHMRMAEPPWIGILSGIYGALHGIQFAIAVYKDIAKTWGQHCHIEV